MSKIRIIKVGGSLFGWHRTREQLSKWLEQQTPAIQVLIGGGGAIVDSMRELDRQIGIDEATCHRMALHGMSATAQLLLSWYPNSKWTDSIENLGSLASSEIVIFDARRWVNECSGLPKTWELTSDSIAAAIAEKTDADELVMLKSCLPKDELTGFFDPLFSHYVATKVTRVVNLRSEQFSESLI